MPSIWNQLAWLLLLAMPVACVAWTVTHEELFREIHEYCLARSEKSTRWYVRKFFFLLTCEYCFSHYVTVVVLALTGFRMLMPGWRGFLISGFSLVWMANIYMGVFGRLRLGIKHERVDIEMKEKVLDES